MKKKKHTHNLHTKHSNNAIAHKTQINISGENTTTKLNSRPFSDATKVLRFGFSGVLKTTHINNILEQPKTIIIKTNNTIINK